MRFYPRGELLIEAELLTGKAYLGGLHRVIFRGKAALIVKNAILDATTAPIVGARVSIEGKLLSHKGHSRVDVKWITLLSPPLNET